MIRKYLVTLCLSSVVADLKNESICPPGFDFDGAECVRVIEVKPSYDCPVGFQKSPSFSKLPHCSNTVVSDPIIECPDGYSLMKGQCSSTESIAADISCPKGTVMNGKTCAIEDTTAPSVICPKNFQLSSKKNSCERRMNVPPTLHCPPGYVNMNNRDCVKQTTEKPIKNCPQSYTYDGQRCVRLQKTDASVQCPRGFTYTAEGKCLKKEISPMGMQCPANTQPDPVTGQCLGTSVLSETYTCPSGDFEYNPDLDKCEILKQADPACPAGYVLNSKTIKCEYQKLAEPIPICPDGSSPPCTRDTSVLADLQCPPDYVDVGGQCVKQVQAPPITVCPKGYVKSSKTNLCEREEARDVIYTCPKDMSLDLKQNVCTRMRTENPIAVCPPDYEPNGEICTSISSAAPSNECPPGFEFDGRGCTRVRVVDPQTSCPQGYRMTFDKEGVLCTKSTTTKSTSSCDKGFNYNYLRKICEAAENVPAVPSCQKGFALSGDVCSKIDVIPARHPRPSKTKF
eukprot:GDKJ01023193.1.p1 GENE.GDKJ01023193.1~~GDKJ01023193.1.p1  ORF type:complete len:512 (+),score=36.37 GDKJ01023193.1:222-1757(+)